MSSDRPGDTPRDIARFLVDATQGRLLDVPPGSAWREGLDPRATPGGDPMHLVLSVDARAPTPARIDQLLREGSSPMLLVSGRPLA